MAVTCAAQQVRQAKEYLLLRLVALAKEYAGHRNQSQQLKEAPFS
jgi:hypothetical protein